MFDPAWPGELHADRRGTRGCCARLVPGDSITWRNGKQGAEPTICCTALILCAKGSAVLAAPAMHRLLLGVSCCLPKELVEEAAPAGEGRARVQVGRGGGLGEEGIGRDVPSRRRSWQALGELLARGPTATAADRPRPRPRPAT